MLLAHLSDHSALLFSPPLTCGAGCTVCIFGLRAEIFISLRPRTGSLLSAFPISSHRGTAILGAIPIFCPRLDWFLRIYFAVLFACARGCASIWVFSIDLRPRFVVSWIDFGLKMAHVCRPLLLRGELSDSSPATEYTTPAPDGLRLRRRSLASLRVMTPCPLLVLRCRCLSLHPLSLPLSLCLSRACRRTHCMLAVSHTLPLSHSPPLSQLAAANRWLPPTPPLSELLLLPAALMFV